MAILKLNGSVGDGSAKGGLPHNDFDDFIKVRNRFVELGYSWVAGISDAKHKDFIRLIRLFQSIVKGRSKFDSGDGRIDRHGDTHRWLAAPNAPGWLDMTGKWGIGWQVTSGLAYGGKNSYTTTWMRDRIVLAGLAYRSKSIFLSDAPPLWIRDMTPQKGGDAPGHKSHETGIDVDMRLPLLPPKTNDWDKLGASDYTKYFYLEAAAAQLESIKMVMHPKYIFFNDPRLIGKGLCTKQKNHGNHYHIRIKPPVRIEGLYL